MVSGFQSAAIQTNQQTRSRKTAQQLTFLFLNKVEVPAMDTPVNTKEIFSELYKDTPPWDIGRPQKMLAEAAPEITGSVLDVGCGTGEHALFFAQQGHEVTGIDFLEKPIESAKKKAAERKIKATFLVQDALQLTGLGRQFDNIIDSGLFHGFSDEQRPRYVASLASVLKPGGKLFLMCFSDKEPGTDGPRRVSQQELSAAFAKGWHIDSLQECHFEITPNIPRGMRFSPGGPYAWFAKIHRE
jgi:2-polyprenyl-3-methyl-5-hydroxy-6-metoxy-1,4-benzoquinol methylase